ncbi:anhydro-N-acetylmuramic acid kinase [Sediminitomix flava]|uniref:Anhydro-N-acetylmuramic acid kinase n=1 Tax=Sediminitomix flava TaxID=379075 RepID=A0A315ZGU8_SEDFL|nr:anhydro-N-acetylmuramic acid kinase [Sediminitomix flava]PWJ44389.1 anhydro-N-acetylmuramic acid kinase [Sediminitomix flava]
MKYKVIGMMSGTSLDGLDLCYVHFDVTDNWKFEIKKSKSVDYDHSLQEKLASVESGSALAYARFDVELGKFFAEEVKKFIDEYQLEVDFICSHGHTIFHQPDEFSLTTQIGSPAHINAITKIPVVADFRTTDVALGGQGAPLVPIGDRLLFSEFRYCLNLGGISNISFEGTNGERLAFDVGIANMPLNHYMRTIGKSYDEDGKLAASGKVDLDILNKLNELDFYKKEGAKSLGKEWVLEYVIPLLDQIPTLEDKLATAVEHASMQIGVCLEKYKLDQNEKCLITGGGAFNSYFIDRIKYYASGVEFATTSSELIEMKEALIFGLLGVLKVRGEVNCLSSVTGALVDNVGGQIYDFNSKLKFV